MKFLLSLFFVFQFSINLIAQEKIKSILGNKSKDSDHDGVIDINDKCSNTPPNTMVDAFGCPLHQQKLPDFDNDGIADQDDSCLKIPGVSSLSGCPDFDGDGLADHLDKCPKQAGKLALSGCPDKDNDGIADHEDQCPDAFGLPYLKGCMDSDGDQIADHIDECPNRRGNILNKGCPEIDKEVIQVLIEAQRSIQFNKGSSKISEKSHSFMLRLVTIMQKNQDLKFDILCYTQESSNQKLNEELAMNRAAEIEAFLISKGIYSKRLSFKSYRRTDRVLTQQGINNQTIIEAKFINP
jgi:OmpA-OmpF porin, OOP family